VSFSKDFHQQQKMQKYKFTINLREKKNAFKRNERNNIPNHRDVKELNSLGNDDEMQGLIKTTKREK